MALAEYVRKHYAWVIVAIGFFVMLTTMGFGRYAYPLILPSMKDGLSLTYTHMGFLGTASLLGYLTFAIPVGMLATRYGARLVITLAALLVGLAMAIIGLTSYYPLALFLMYLGGIGIVGSIVPLAGIVAAWFPPGQRGFFMAVATGGASFGILITSYLIPAIIASHGDPGWRWAWAYIGIATLVSALPTYIALRDRPGNGKDSTTSAQAINPTNKESSSWRAVFRNRTILGLSWAYFLHGFYLLYVTFYVSFLTRKLLLPTGLASNIWFWAGLMNTFSVALWASVSDRIGRKATMIPCLFLLVLAILWPVFFQDVFSLYLSAMLFGLTFGAPMIIILTAATDNAGPGMASVAAGLVTTAFGTGQVIAPAIGGFLIDLTGSFSPGFALTAAIFFIEIISLMMTPIPRNRVVKQEQLPMGSTTD